MAHQRVKALGLGDYRSYTKSEGAPGGIRARWLPLRQGLLPCSKGRGRNAEQEVMRSTSSPKEPHGLRERVPRYAQLLRMEYSVCDYVYGNGLH